MAGEVVILRCVILCAGLSKQFGMSIENSMLAIDTSFFFFSP